jgi:hypothetical protein
MISNFTVVTVPQWAIFAAVTIIFYGWTEKKRVFELIGLSILILLGLFSAWVIWSGLLLPEGLFDTAETFGGEELFAPDDIPLEGRMLPVYWGMTVTGAVALVTFLLELNQSKTAKAMKVVSIILALLMFFGMIGISRMT